MAKQTGRLILVAMFLSISLLSGCAMHVKMNPILAQVNIQDKHINAKVGLYLDETFSNYHWQGNNVAEMSKMDYELGAASKSLFLEAFLRVAASVVLVNGDPPYAEAEKKDIAIVVRPAIVRFAEDHSAILRIANYTATITYHVTVRDATGAVLLDRDFAATGVAKGEATYSPASNYAAAAEKAMTTALSEIIEAVAKLTPAG